MELQMQSPPSSLSTNGQPTNDERLESFNESYCRHPLEPVQLPSSYRWLKKIEALWTKENLFLFVLCHVFTATGLIISIVGPTLTSLAAQVHCSFDTIVWGFTFRSIGFLVGGLVGPVMAEHHRWKPFPKFSLLVPFSCQFICVLVTPWCQAVWILFLVFLMQGFSIAASENICKMLVVRLYPEKSAPLMNLMFGFFGVGGILAPLIVSGFLPTAVDDNDVTPSTSYQYAFYVVVAILSPNIFFLVGMSYREEWPRIKELYFSSASQAVSPIPNSPIPSPSSSSPPAKPVNPPSFLVAMRAMPRGQALIALGASFVIFFYVGVEGYASFLATLAKVSYGLSPSSASVLTSAFWVTFTCGRMAAVPASSKFKPMVILGADCTVMVLALCLLLTAPGNVTVLWLGSLLYGLSLSSIYACTLNWYAEYFPLDGPVIALTTIGDSAGAALLPLVVGATITDNTSPSDGSVGYLTSPISCIILFLVMTLLIALFLACLQYWLLPKYAHLTQQPHKDRMAAEAEPDQPLEKIEVTDGVNPFESNPDQPIQDQTNTNAYYGEDDMNEPDPSAMIQSPEENPFD